MWESVEDVRRSLVLLLSFPVQATQLPRSQRGHRLYAQVFGISEYNQSVKTISIIYCIIFLPYHCRRPPPRRSDSLGNITAFRRLFRRIPLAFDVEFLTSRCFRRGSFARKSVHCSGGFRRSRAWSPILVGFNNRSTRQKSGTTTLRSFQDTRLRNPTRITSEHLSLQHGFRLSREAFKKVVQRGCDSGVDFMARGNFMIF